MSYPNVTTVGDLLTALWEVERIGWPQEMDVRIATFAQIAAPVGKSARRDLVNGLPGLRGLWLPRSVGAPGDIGQEPIILVVDPMPDGWSS